MAIPVSSRLRAKVSITVDPTLLKCVDDYVKTHPGIDRSKVFQEALYLWQTRQQEQAMVEQYLAAPSNEELSM